MTTKEYLSQIQKLNVLIDQRICEKNALKEFDGISGIDYSADKVQTSHSGTSTHMKCEALGIEDASERVIFV